MCYSHAKVLSCSHYKGHIGHVEKGDNHRYEQITSHSLASSLCIPWEQLPCYGVISSLSVLIPFLAVGCTSGGRDSPYHLYAADLKPRHCLERWSISITTCWWVSQEDFLNKWMSEWENGPKAEDLMISSPGSSQTETSFWCIHLHILYRRQRTRVRVSQLVLLYLLPAVCQYHAGDGKKSHSVLNTAGPTALVYDCPAEGFIRATIKFAYLREKWRCQVLANIQWVN